MAIRTTVDIPEPLYARLRRRSEATGTSMRSLIVGALETALGERGGGRRVAGPMIPATGRRGPRYPKDENPHDIVFS